MRPEVLPAAMVNIGRQKSVPTTPAPVISNNASDKSPVPHATSRTRALSPDESFSRTRVATIRRQRLSTLPESKWFKRSYRLAIDANISRTRPACSFAALPFSGTVKPNPMEVWLQNACEQFVITWDCYCLLVSQVVSVLLPGAQSHRVLRIEDDLPATVSVEVFHPQRPWQ